ncbi:hypothetical protein B0H13DRAFT_2350279 [Mycena leptocephala]|nr:hypothetical protein B0H13DRAFT_2350279 [Mycena leptocephala]
MPLAQQHQSPLCIVHCYHVSTSPSAPSSTSAPNSSRIHACFDYLTAPTSLSHWPSPLRSWISLITSRSRIIHRGVELCGSSSFASIMHALARLCGLLPASFLHVDSQTTVSSVGRFFVGGAARCVHATLPPLFYLFASVGGSSSERIHPVKQLRRYLPCRAHPHANPRVSYACDGGGWRWRGRRWGLDDEQMQVDEDGEARGRDGNADGEDAALALVPASPSPLSLPERAPTRLRLGEMEKRGCGYGCGRAQWICVTPDVNRGGVHACAYGVTRPRTRPRARTGLVAFEGGGARAYTFGLDEPRTCPPISLLLAIFLFNSIGSCYLRFMYPIPSPSIHIHTAIALNEK